MNSMFAKNVVKKLSEVGLVAMQKRYFIDRRKRHKDKCGMRKEFNTTKKRASRNIQNSCNVLLKITLNSRRLSRLLLRIGLLH